MKTNTVILSALMFAASAWAQAPAPAPAKAPLKVATINIQAAIVQTKDGQAAAQQIQTKYTPRRQELEKKQTEITNIQNQMRSGSATMSEAAKAKLQRDYDTNSKEFTRSRDDFEAELQQEEGKLMNELGQKVMDVVIKYAAQNGVAAVLDVSQQGTPVLWADPSVDITNEIIKLYDQGHPGTGTAPAPASAKPPAAPPTKKQ